MCLAAKSCVRRRWHGASSHMHSVVGMCTEDVEAQTRIDLCYANSTAAPAIRMVTMSPFKNSSVAAHAVSKQRCSGSSPRLNESPPLQPKRPQQGTPLAGRCRIRTTPLIAINAFNLARQEQQTLAERGKRPARSSPPGVKKGKLHTCLAHDKVRC